MNAIVLEHVRVDAERRVAISDARLTPGDEVELVVRLVPRKDAAPAASLWELSSQISIDAPPDYSVNFEQR